MKIKREYEDLKGTEKRVCDLCRSDQKACDSNTELCIAFWNANLFLDYEPDESWMYVIRHYPPESLTKYRRNLIFDGLIHPTEKSRKHSAEMEAKNHKKVYQHNAEEEWNNAFRRTTA